jgi:hypothetical protein
MSLSSRPLLLDRRLLVALAELCHSPLDLFYTGPQSSCDAGPLDLFHWTAVFWLGWQVRTASPSASDLLLDRCLLAALAELRHLRPCA